MNYWGIWILDSKCWLQWESGELIYYPSRTLACIKAKQLYWFKPEEVEVREMTLDSLKDIKVKLYED